MYTNIRKATIIVFTVSLLLAGAGAFFVLTEKERDFELVREETSGTREEGIAEVAVSEEEFARVRKEAKDAIALAESVIAQAEEYLARQRDSGTKDIEGIKEERRGDGVKGVYMTGGIAAGQGAAARALRDSIVRMIEETELNAVVIDVKEAQGPFMPLALVQFAAQMKTRGIWTIARIVAFADSSQLAEHPDWYAKTASGDFWIDFGGRHWLDPASEEAQDYIIDFSKTVIDAGFDESQYDYIRFPTDGNLADIVYPSYDGTKTMSGVIGDFFARLSEELRAHKEDTVLSVDLFGLAATQRDLPAIGQRLSDAAAAFDFISPMLYPSHFYGGFVVSADTARGLPALSFPYDSPYPLQTVSAHPYEVVYRSLLSASDYIDSIGGKALLRPWLQDFSLRFDTQRGIIYDVEKVRLQIKAAEDVGASGWLLWNPKNIYTRDALTK